MLLMGKSTIKTSNTNLGTSRRYPLLALGKSHVRMIIQEPYQPYQLWHFGHGLCRAIFKTCYTEVYGVYIYILYVCGLWIVVILSSLGIPF